MLQMSVKVASAPCFKKKVIEIDKTSVRRVCIDDFAFKKGRRYGTILIDIDTGRIIDLLDSREVDDVAKWLASYPNIELVCRDGSLQYAAAIKQAHPDAIQVSDRFHIAKNLYEYATDALKTMLPALFRIEIEADDQEMDSDCCEQFECHGASLPEKSHMFSVEKKRALVEQVRSLARDGFSIADIAEEVGICCATAKKYLNANFAPENKLEPYVQKVDKMLQESYKLKEIETAIREDGYNGSTSILQMYTTQQRKIMKAENEYALRNTELIDRKQVISAIYRPLEQVKNLTIQQAETIFREYPAVKEIYGITHSFREIMSTKQADKLESWIESALLLGIKEMNSFVNGIRRDFEAVKNGIALKYNNGIAEGSVNKLKVMKRIMYGRSNFPLFRNKILLKEYNW
jgi:hypothetical protein